MSFASLRQVTSAWVLVLALAWGVHGCTTTPTEIVTGMTTQIQVPKDLKAVGVVVHLGGRLIFCESYDVEGGTATLPSTLGAVPAEGRDQVPVEPVTVTVLGFRTPQGEQFSSDCVVQIPDADADEVMVVRRRRLPYQPERIVYLPMPLKASCENVACEDDETCLGGVCEDNLLSGDDVVDYDEALIFGTGNTCFSPETCLSPALTQPAVLTDASDCTFSYPALPGSDPPEVTPGHLNVEVIYSSFNSEILDLDDREGFILDPSDPLSFRLAPNLCESNYKQGKILAVRVAPGCPSKAPLQPICLEALKEIQAGARNPVANDAACTVSNALTPTESALYVLMDRSSSMGELYGPEGLQFAVETPLKNPLAARTRMALSFLPAAQGACTTSPYLTPDIGFDDVEVVRDPIASALGDPSQVLPGDPMLYLDGALEGAYEALAQLDPSVSASFNRKALVIVGNRDFQQHCSDPGAESPATLAQQALEAEGIYTYVAVLEAPAGAEQFGGDPVADATTLAAAGGTEVFNGVQDEAAGALAVQQVINDLGSCVYDVPPGFLDDQEVALSYADPITLERRDIPRNDQCSDGANVDGWARVTDPNTGGEQIRICGARCEQLRDSLGNLAAFYAALGQPAPNVPIVASLPCDKLQ